MDRVCVVIITDGRINCISRLFPSFEKNLIGSIKQVLVIDDSAKPSYAKGIEALFPTFKGIPCTFCHHSNRIGFGETVRTTMEMLPKDCDYVLWLEDDFTLNKELVLDDWCGVLEKHPDVVQIAAYRQPWSQAEIDAKGFFNMRPGAYKNMDYLGRDGAYFPVVENKSNWTTNPCLFPRWVVDKWKWPTEQYSEGVFGFQIFEAGYKMLYWGKMTDEPLVHHDGQRQGTGY